MADTSTERDYANVTCGLFWRRKMRTLFRKFDVGCSNRLTLDDMLDVATTILTTFPKMADYKGDNLIKAIVDFWFKVVVFNNDDQCHRIMLLVLEHEFLDNMSKRINEEMKNMFFDGFVKPLFDTADGDDDGKISTMEYRQLMRAFRVSDKENDVAFKKMDTDNDNKVSVEEFRRAWANFFFGEDEKKQVPIMGANLVSYKRPEEFGEIDCGAFWESKMRVMFRRLDVSGNNRLTCQDFIQIGRTLAQRSHMDKVKTSAVMRSMINIWVKFIAVDATGKQYSEITEKQFIQHLRDTINGTFRHDLDMFGWTFFRCVETGGDGMIGVQEYRNLQEAWRVSREEADNLFKVLDCDGDGQISQDEYLNAWMDYFLGEDKTSPFQTFFGPVIVKPPQGK